MMRKEVENWRAGGLKDEGEQKGEEWSRYKNLNWGSMRRSSTFREQWRLLIKAPYWSFSITSPFSLIFISLSRTPRGGKASICWWEVIEQGKDCRHSLCGLKGARMCVFFGQAPSHLIWVSFHPQCHNVLLYSVKNQHWPCCSGDHFQSFPPMHTDISILLASLFLFNSATEYFT